jgi:hypothetical protein
MRGIIATGFRSSGGLQSISDEVLTIMYSSGMNEGYTTLEEPFGYI